MQRRLMVIPQVWDFIIEDKFFNICSPLSEKLKTTFIATLRWSIFWVVTTASTTALLGRRPAQEFNELALSYLTQ